MGAFLSLACSVKRMLTLILGTVILALFYGGFWHNQPASRQTTREETFIKDHESNGRYARPKSTT
jgi:hypothetical protein